MSVALLSTHARSSKTRDVQQNNVIVSTLHPPCWLEDHRAQSTSRTQIITPFPFPTLSIKSLPIAIHSTSLNQFQSKNIFDFVATNIRCCCGYRASGNVEQCFFTFTMFWLRFRLEISFTALSPSTLTRVITRSPTE